MDWTSMEAWSYLVTVIGLPLAIFVFIWEQRRERRNEDEELYQRLADEYADFLKLVLENSDLQLRSRTAVVLTDEQRERRMVLYELLVSLFERAYILVYDRHMNRQQRRLWQSWEDWIGEWMQREDFRALLPELLRGEDPDFVEHITGMAALLPPARASERLPTAG